MPVTPALSIGSKKKFITPEWIRGKPPTGVLVAPQTTYHRIRQIASKNQQDVPCRNAAARPVLVWKCPGKRQGTTLVTGVLSSVFAYLSLG